MGNVSFRMGGFLENSEKGKFYFESISLHSLAIFSIISILLNENFLSEVYLIVIITMLIFKPRRQLTHD